MIKLQQRMRGAENESSKRNRPFGLTALIMLVGGLVVVGGCDSKGHNAIKHQTQTTRRGDIERRVTATGTLNAVASVDVGCQVSGRIAVLHVDYNSLVKKGDLVAEIDPALYQAALQQKEGELLSAKALALQKRQSFERKRELLPQRAATTLDVEMAQAELSQAEASVMVNEAALRKAQVDLGYCRIVAPVDGVVIARKVDQGQTVAATMTTPVLFTIAQDIREMRIRAVIPESDVGVLAVDQDVEFTVDAYPDETFHGRVDQVRKAPITVDNVVTYEAMIAVKNPEQKLFPGMTADVAIRVARRENALLLPNAALRYRLDPSVPLREAVPTKLGVKERLVYRVAADGQGLIPVVVKLGITDQRFTEIVAGLSDQEALVTQTDLPKSAPSLFKKPDK